MSSFREMFRRPPGSSHRDSYCGSLVPSVGLPNAASNHNTLGSFSQGTGYSQGSQDLVPYKQSSLDFLRKYSHQPPLISSSQIHGSLSCVTQAAPEGVAERAIQAFNGSKDSHRLENLEDGVRDLTKEIAALSATLREHYDQPGKTVVDDSITKSVLSIEQRMAKTVDGNHLLRRLGLIEEEVGSVSASMLRFKKELVHEMSLLRNLVTAKSDELQGLIASMIQELPKKANQAGNASAGFMPDVSADEAHGSTGSASFSASFNDNLAAWPSGVFLGEPVLAEHSRKQRELHVTDVEAKSDGLDVDAELEAKRIVLKARRKRRRLS